MAIVYHLKPIIYCQLWYTISYLENTVSYLQYTLCNLEHTVSYLQYTATTYTVYHLLTIYRLLPTVCHLHPTFYSLPSPQNSNCISPQSPALLISLLIPTMPRKNLRPEQSFDEVLPSLLFVCYVFCPCLCLLYTSPSPRD